MGLDIGEIIGLRNITFLPNLPHHSDKVVSTLNPDLKSKPAVGAHNMFFDELQYHYIYLKLTMGVLNRMQIGKSGLTKIILLKLKIDDLYVF